MNIDRLKLNNNRVSDIRVIVYSGGKTGSVSLFKSFNSIARTMHTHGDEYLHYIHPSCKKHNITIRKIIDYHKNRGNQLLIASCYREPISRRISSFFENIRSHMKMCNTEVHKVGIPGLIKRFLELLPTLETYWPHLNEDFGDIDIFSKEFNKEYGFQMYENGLIKVLMIRFDKIGDAEQIVRNNTIYKEFKMIADNMSSSKWYNNIYTKFKEQLVIPKDFLDRIFNDPIEKRNLEYFYDGDKLEEIKNYWYNKVQTNDK